MTTIAQCRHADDMKETLHGNSHITALMIPPSDDLHALTAKFDQTALLTILP
jgi:hypothetical protein